MAEVAISQLQEWSFAKSLARAERADSAAGSPELYAPEPIEIPAKIEEKPAIESSSECMFQDRYLSSEEDLSPMEPDFGDSDFDDDEVFEVVEAEAVAAPAPRQKPCDMAVMVSYVSAGRAKIVNVPTAAPPRLERLRSASIAVPTTTPSAGTKLNRLSLSSSNDSRPSDDRRRRSVSFGNSITAFQNNTSRLSISSSSEENSAWTGSTSPSNSPRRPSTSRSLAQAARNSIQMFAKPSAYFGPPSQSPSSSHSFLNSDPFSDGVTSAASPTIKPGSAHKRLRSISRSLALAKIAISKPKSTMPSDSPLTTPRTPMSPDMPKSAGVAVRRKLVPRGANEREPILELPPVPAEVGRSTEVLPMRVSTPVQFQSPRSRTKLVPRAADERAAPLELPPFPLEDDDDSSMHNAKGTMARKTKLRKRKSLLGLVG